jgi:16S rRNA G966 N2-methylase RsmD
LKEYIFSDPPKLSKRLLKLIGKKIKVKYDNKIYKDSTACVIEDDNEEYYFIPTDCLKKIE